MGLACASFSCDGFNDKNFDPTFRLLPKIGYEYVELNCWHPSNLTPSAITNIRRRCTDAKIEPVAVTGSSFGGTGFDISKDVAHKLRLIDAAVELDCRRVVASGPHRDRDSGIGEVIEVLRQVTPYAERWGVLLCLENHVDNSLETIEDYERVFSKIDSPNVGLCLDTGHFEAAGIDPVDVVNRFHGRILHVHVKETSVRGSKDFVRFGEGTTDNERIFDTLVDQDYRGYITVELPIADKSNCMADLKKPLKMFKKYIE